MDVKGRIEHYNITVERKNKGIRDLLLLFIAIKIYGSYVCQSMETYNRDFLLLTLIKQNPPSPYKI